MKIVFTCLLMISLATNIALFSVYLKLDAEKSIHKLIIASDRLVIGACNDFLKGRIKSRFSPIDEIKAVKNAGQLNKGKINE